jgi:quinol monooxygenase YgiN
MHIVVNHLPIKPDADWNDIASKFEKFAKETRATYTQMKVAMLSKASEGEAIFVGIYADMETLDHVSKNVAAPWFAENIRQYLAGPAARTVANGIAGSVGGDSAA